jgi:hypothetical protein
MLILKVLVECICVVRFAQQELQGYPHDMSAKPVTSITGFTVCGK